jgi:hypothetical protein
VSAAGLACLCWCLLGATCLNLCRRQQEAVFVLVGPRSLYLSACLASSCLP